ncbi:hypothetical protein [Streptomyces mexicanus]|uniref:hypothetical protein n=1 Tax=Streptomyces mexicanus TaxID=178566 RepID=UPI00368191D9
MFFCIMGGMDGRPIDESRRAKVTALAEQEERVVLRLRPYTTFATPPGIHRIRYR